MSDHAGIRGDQAIRAANVQAVIDNPLLRLCSWCDGTGNELYAMYRRCPKCQGEGLIDQGDTDAD